MLKNSLYILYAVFILYGCNQIEDEDEKITEALIGKYYEDDYEDDGTKLKGIKGEYFKDGSFLSEATIELIDEESLEHYDISFKLVGKWNVEKSLVYFTYDFDKIKILPEFYSLFFRDELIKILKEENQPNRILDYDETKVVYQDVDGKRQIMKKIE